MSLRNSDRRARRNVVGAAREMARLGLVSGTIGNVSVRTPRGVLITPSRTPYERMRPRDLVRLGKDDGEGTPSREWPLHLAIYGARPDVGAVVHTHSLHATAWSFRGGGELPEVEELAYYGIGSVAVSPRAVAGSEELADHAVEALGAAGAALLGEHGVVAVGGSVADALTTAIVVERQATIAWLLEGSAVLVS